MLSMHGARFNEAQAAEGLGTPRQACGPAEFHPMHQVRVDHNTRGPPWYPLSQQRRSEP